MQTVVNAKALATTVTLTLSARRALVASGAKSTNLAALEWPIHAEPLLSRAGTTLQMQTRAMPMLDALARLATMAMLQPGRDRGAMSGQSQRCALQVAKGPFVRVLQWWRNAQRSPRRLQRPQPEWHPMHALKGQKVMMIQPLQHARLNA